MVDWNPGNMRNPNDWSPGVAGADRSIWGLPSETSPLNTQYGGLPLKGGEGQVMAGTQADALAPAPTMPNPFQTPAEALAATPGWHKRPLWERDRLLALAMHPEQKEQVNG